MTVTTTLYTVLVLAVALRILLLRYRLHAKLRSAGCLPAPQLWSSWNLPAAIDLTVRILLAGRDGRVTGYLKTIFASMRRKLGFNVKTVHINRLGNVWILTTDDTNIHSVLALQRDRFNYGSRKLWFQPFLGPHSIFGLDGSSWKLSRNIIRNALTKTRINDTIAIHQNASELVRIVAEAPDIIDVQSLFENYTTSTSTQFLGILDRDTRLVEDEKKFQDALDIADRGIMIRVVLSNLYWLYNSKAFRQACRFARSVAEASVKRALLAHQDDTSGKPRKDRKVMDDLILYTRDEDRLISMALDLIVAGKSTSSALLSNLVLYLARHTDSYARLRQEVLQAFGPVETNEYLTFEQLKDCQYLQWCMSETLRLSPPAAFGLATASTDVVLPRGGGPDGEAPILVEKGTDVIWSFALLHRDPDYWGADADEWRPERFSGRKTTQGYHPFSSGPRICPGQQLALTTAAYAIIRICQNFERIEDHNPTGEPRQRFALVTTNLDGVNVKFF